MYIKMVRIFVKFWHTCPVRVTVNQISIQQQWKLLHKLVVGYTSGGHLYLKLDIILVKKKFMYLGLFFRTIQCTCVHRLGVQKRPKLEKKGVFLAILTSLGKEMTDKLRKTHAKTCIGFIFIPEKYVFRVCFESPFTRMISSLKYKWPPGAIPGLKGLYLKLL